MQRELTQAAADFLHRFEVVFDSDWEFTKDMIQDPAGYIEGTFVSPGVADEENNWANRARLLESYRRLKALLPPRGAVKEIGDLGI